MRAEDRSASVARVLSGDLCVGCGLCEGVGDGAFRMETCSRGYARPVQVGAVSDAAEQRIAAACPGLSLDGWPQDADTYWGPARQVVTAFAKDPQVRFEGSSGGALTALATHALVNGLVDGVVHVSASTDHPLGNSVQVSRNVDEIRLGAGSRYAPSSPLDKLDVLLAGDERFVFIGKPCDISALRRLSEIDARVTKVFPYMLSFFCGGIPSRVGSLDILATMGVAVADVVRFRYRGQGWPGLTVAETRDGSSHEMRYEESWGEHLSKRVQFRCKICPDAVGGTADLAAADAWYGGETGYPQFEEQEGRSLLMVRTEAGQALVNGCIDHAELEIAPLDVRQIDLMQPSQANRKRLVAARVAACRSLGQPVPKMANLKLREASREAPFLLKLRNYFGTIRRIILDRR